MRNSRSCSGQNFPWRAPHIASSDAGTELRCIGSGKFTNTTRTFPVATYSRSRAGIVCRANSAQNGHWKSEISYIVTGAVARPLLRAAIS